MPSNTACPCPSAPKTPPTSIPSITDTDDEFAHAGNGHELLDQPPGYEFPTDLAAYQQQAQNTYEAYRSQLQSRFDWLDPKFFRPDLQEELLRDARALLDVLKRASRWQPDRDSKLQTLHRFLTKTHPRDKVLIFTQFADTARYLANELRRAGITDLDVATSDTADPVALARRFSPRSNGGLRKGETELRVLIATDVLSEGQNLQDAHIIVNFDLPWAIIRLIQRAGRVDRIGQQHDTILAYSFLPAEGVDRIIRLRTRLMQRLEQNQEVIGTDESFFGEEAKQKLHDLYTEKRILDDDADEEVDLVSFAQQVWNSAAEADRKAAQALPPVVPAARAARPADVQSEPEPPGLVTYLRYPDGTDALVRVDASGQVLSQSLSAIFRSAACGPDTSPLPLAPNHYDLVAACVRAAHEEQLSLSGQLGSLRSTRRKLYERLKNYRERLKANPDLFSKQTLERLDRVLDALLRSPLKQSASESLSRQMRLGIVDDQLAENVFRLHEEDRLSQPIEIKEAPEPQILCSLAVHAINPS